MPNPFANIMEEEKEPNPFSNIDPSGELTKEPNPFEDVAPKSTSFEDIRKQTQSEIVKIGNELKAAEAYFDPFASEADVEFNERKKKGLRDELDKYRNVTEVPSLFQHAKSKFRAGQVPVIRGHYGAQAMFGKMDVQTAMQEADKATKKQIGEAGVKDFPFTRAPFRYLIGEAAELLPFIIGASGEAAKYGLMTGGALGLTALAAGQAGPQIALPEEVITVPSSFATGVTVGAPFGVVKYSMEKEGGNLYLDLIKNDISPRVAKPLALGGGMVIGLIEVAQLRMLSAPLRLAFAKTLGTPVVKNALLKAVINYVEVAGGGIAEEELQEVVILATETLAGMIEKNPDAIPSKSKWTNRLIEVAKKSAAGMATLALPGAAVEISTAVVDELAKPKVAPIEEKIAEEVVSIEEEVIEEVAPIEKGVIEEELIGEEEVSEEFEPVKPIPLTPEEKALTRKEPALEIKERRVDGKRKFTVGKKGTEGYFAYNTREEAQAKIDELEEKAFKEAPLTKEAQKYKTPEEFVKSRDRTYHVTLTSKIKGIQEKGIAPQKKATYRGGFGQDLRDKDVVYAFKSYDDAVRWAGKMEYDLGKPVSIVSMEGVTGEKDMNVQMQMFGLEKSAIKVKGTIAPENIKNIEPHNIEKTREVVTSLREGKPIIDKQLTAIWKRAQPIPKGLITVPKPAPEVYSAIRDEFYKQYTPNAKLTGEEKLWQKRGEIFATKHGGEIIEDYLARNVNLSAIDIMRDYFVPAGFDGTNSNAFHEPASGLKKVVDFILRERAKEEGKMGLLKTGGGSGSGKTSLLNTMNRNERDSFGYILDSNLAKPQNAVDALKEDMEEGFKPRYLYVYRDVVDSWTNGVLARIVSGKDMRVVPLSKHINLHKGALETARAIIKQLGDRVKTTLINNSFGKGKYKKFTARELQEVEPDVKGLKEVLTNGTIEVYKEGLISLEMVEASIERGLTTSEKRLNEGAKPSYPAYSPKAKVPLKKGYKKITPSEITSEPIISTPEGREEAITKPIGEGEERMPTLVQRVEDSLISAEEAKGITYNRLDIKRDAALAVDFVDKHPKIARKIAFNEESPPEGITGSAIREAYRHSVENNLEEYKKVTQAEAFREVRLGQEIATLKEWRTRSDPMQYIKDVIAQRLKSIATHEITFETQTAKKGTQKGGELRLRKETNTAKEKISSKSLKFSNAQAILESITCP